ncbi:MAG TPA: hypothetical protein VGD68_17220 [Streptosporangiaceae bacterium]
MAGPADGGGGVRWRGVARAALTARRPGPAAAVSLLAGIVLAGCTSGPPPVRTAPASPAPPPGSASAGPSPGTVAASPPSSPNGPDGTAGPVAGGTGSGPGCARWPAGSTRTALLITRASNGQRYCVRTGETVQVSQSGTLSLTAGSEPPRLTGTALVPAPVRTGQAIRSSAALYLAVRAGTAVLTVVRLPCRSVRPQAPAGGTTGTGALGGAGGGGTSEAAVEMAYTGGAPVGAQCQLEEMLRVTIVVS